MYCFIKTLKALDTRVANGFFFSRPRWVSSVAGTDGFFWSVLGGVGGVASANQAPGSWREPVLWYPEKGGGWVYIGQCIKVLILPRQLKGLLSNVLIKHLRMLAVNLCMFVWDFLFVKHWDTLVGILNVWLHLQRSFNVHFLLVELQFILILHNCHFCPSRRPYACSPSLHSISYLGTLNCL